MKQSPSLSRRLPRCTQTSCSHQKGGTQRIHRGHPLQPHLLRAARFRLSVVADDAAGLGPVLVRGRHPVRQVRQRRELLLHVQDVAVHVHALPTGEFPGEWYYVMTSLLTRGCATSVGPFEGSHLPNQLAPGAWQRRALQHRRQSIIQHPGSTSASWERAAEPQGHADQAADTAAPVGWCCAKR